MAGDIPHAILRKFPQPMYPCAWCLFENQGSIDRLSWVDNADDFICDVCIERTYTARGKSTGKVIPFVDLFEQMRR